MCRYTYCLTLFPLLVLTGCFSGKAPPPVVQDEGKVLLFLDPELRPEKVQVPRYLLLPETEILRHGRISGSRLVGSELKSAERLEDLEARYRAELEGRGWKISKDDRGAGWVRLQLIRGMEWLEVRGVQGGRFAYLYLLYRKDR